MLYFRRNLAAENSHVSCSVCFGVVLRVQNVGMLVCLGVVTRVV
jgi:hypothetical protein